jgi:hypothetical protein
VGGPEVTTSGCRRHKRSAPFLDQRNHGKKPKLPRCIRSQDLLSRRDPDVVTSGLPRAVLIVPRFLTDSDF